MKKFSRWILAIFQDQTFYQVRSENQTYWVTCNEWHFNQRNIPNAKQVICATETKETNYANQ